MSIQAKFIYDDNLAIERYCNVATNDCAHYCRFNGKIWLLIPKNGCQTVCHSAEAYLGRIENIDVPLNWNRMLRNTTTLSSIIKDRMGEEFVGFYRDPIDRFVSFVNYTFTQGVPAYVALRTDLHGEEGSDQWKIELIQRVIAYCIYNNSTVNVNNCDQHVLSQYMYVKMLTEPSGGFDSLTLYDIKYMRKILEHEGLEFKHMNAADGHLVEKDIPELYREQIRFIYRDDYRYLLPKVVDPDFLKNDNA